MSKIIKIAIPVLLACYLTWGFVSKFVGIKSIILEVALLVPNIIVVLPFIAVFFLKGIGKKITLLLFGLFNAYMLVVFFQMPQTSITRFYYQVKNHMELSNLSVNDISYITIGDVTIDRPEQIEPVVKVLNKSMWYSPNKSEHTSKEVPMMVVLRTGQKMEFLIAQFYDEDSVDLLFTRPNEWGYWADGNAYVPKLPSTLENLGYPLAPEYYQP